MDNTFEDYIWAELCALIGRISLRSEPSLDKAQRAVEVAAKEVFEVVRTNRTYPSGDIATRRGFRIAKDVEAVSEGNLISFFPHEAAQTRTVKQMQDAAIADGADFGLCDYNLIYKRVSSPLSGRCGYVILPHTTLLCRDGTEAVAFAHFSVPHNVANSPSHIELVFLRSDALFTSEHNVYIARKIV